jgi:hypothetical protein
MSTLITLTAQCLYNSSYPPKDAAKPYVARITGRAKGALMFERDFLGQGSVSIDEPGLYEVQHGLKKGGYSRSYIVVVQMPDGELRRSSNVGKEDAMSIAKRLDGGEQISDIAELSDPRPHDRRPEQLVYETCGLRTKAQAKAATAAAAADQCMAILSALPEPQRKAVLAELRKRMAPAAAAA